MKKINSTHIYIVILCFMLHCCCFLVWFLYPYKSKDFSPLPRRYSNQSVLNEEYSSEDKSEARCCTPSFLLYFCSLPIFLSLMKVFSWHLHNFEYCYSMTVRKGKDCFYYLFVWIWVFFFAHPVKLLQHVLCQSYAWSVHSFHRHQTPWWQKASFKPLRYLKIYRKPCWEKKHEEKQ